MMNDFKNFSTSLMFSSMFSFIFGTLLLIAGIPITVVLPTTAPVWMGVATMLFMTLNGI